MPTKAIAELAGVSESTFFRIYKSKAALLSDLLYIMTPGPEDIPMKEMTNGTDIRKDFELFLYHNALLHVRHLPVFRLAMHVEEIYDKSRFSKIEGMISQMAGYFHHLQEIGFLIEFDYRALAEHVNSLALVKANEFVITEFPVQILAVKHKASVPLHHLQKESQLIFKMAEYSHRITSRTAADIPNGSCRITLFRKHFQRTL